jgi:hypothetical protein
MPEAGVVQDDEQHVGRAFLGPVGFRPGWLGLVVRAADDAGESTSGFIFFEGHFFSFACFDFLPGLPGFPGLADL